MRPLTLLALLLTGLLLGAVTSSAFATRLSGIYFENSYRTGDTFLMRFRDHDEGAVCYVARTNNGLG
jgi:hypothetical protein